MPCTPIPNLSQLEVVTGLSSSGVKFIIGIVFFLIVVHTKLILYARAP